MKILALMTFDIFRCSLGEAIKELGHEVLFLGEFDAAQLEKTIEQFSPDMVIDMGWDIWHMKKRKNLQSISDILKKHHIFHVYFAEEDWLHFERWSRHYCTLMRPSFVLTRSHRCIPLYEQMSINSSYFDVGCNPSFHKKLPINPSYASDVVVVANGNFFLGEIRFKSIYDLVIPLFDQEFDLKIWGRDWENIHRYYPGKKAKPRMLQGILPFTNTPKCYSSAKICISVQTCNDQLSNRTLDILSSGGFLLTSDTKAVRQKLEPGINCVISSSPAETLQLVNYYLNHEEERNKIAMKGRVAAVERFSYQQTLRLVWPEIEWEYKKHRLGLTILDDENLLENANFTESKKVGWKFYNASINTSICYKGSNSVQFKSGKSKAYIKQKVLVKPGKKYLLKGSFAKLGQGKGAPLNIKVKFYTKKNQLLEMGLYGSLFFTDLSDIKEKRWFPYRGITIQTPKRTAYALIIIKKNSCNKSVPILGSDFVLREV